MEKQLKKLTDKKVKCRLKKITVATLENLRLTTLKVNMMFISKVEIFTPFEMKRFFTLILIILNYRAVLPFCDCLVGYMKAL